MRDNLKISLKANKLQVEERGGQAAPNLLQVSLLQESLLQESLSRASFEFRRAERNCGSRLSDEAVDHFLLACFLESNGELVAAGLHHMAVARTRPAVLRLAARWL